MPDHALPKRQQPALFLPALLVLVMLAATGCTQAQYAAGTLPQQYVAKPRVGLSDIDLSQLARSAPPTEMLHPGDTITVAIVTGMEEREAPAHELRIGDDGTVGVPLVGPVRLAGMTLTEAEKAIASEGQNRGLYVNPNVTVSIVKPRSVRVTVAGAVNKPATYDLPASNSTLLAALTMAEGLSMDAETVVEIRTPTRNVPGQGGVQQASYPGAETNPLSATRVDLTKASEYSAESLELRDGSVVMVPSKTPGTISVLGLVKSPGNFELPDGRETYLLDAVAMAGGTTLSVANRVLVTRRTADGSLVTISSSLTDAKANGAANLLLAEGDIVNIEETPATVALDAIRSFFRIGFSSALPLF